VHGGTRRSTLLLVLVGLAAALLPIVLGAARVSADPTVVEHTDVDYGGGQRLDAFLPDRPSGLVPAVLIVHGGGWKTGDKAGWAPRARDVVRQLGWAAFTIDYDLDARRPWVTQPNDVRDAIAWVRANAATFGVDPHRIALFGSSAGGHLAMLVATTATLGEGVSAVVSWSGPSDLPKLERDPTGEPRVKRLAARYAGAPLTDAPGRWVDGSPVAHVDRSDPPMFLAASASETMVPVGQLVTMRDALAANGVPVETAVLSGRRHASAFGDDVWRETLQFLREHV